jgi:hypothetical protein
MNGMTDCLACSGGKCIGKCHFNKPSWTQRKWGRTPSRQTVQRNQPRPIALLTVRPGGGEAVSQLCPQRLAVASLTGQKLDLPTNRMVTGKGR